MEWQGNPKKSPLHRSFGVPPGYSQTDRLLCCTPRLHTASMTFVVRLASGTIRCASTCFEQYEPYHPPAVWKNFSSAAKGGKPLSVQPLRTSMQAKAKNERETDSKNREANSRYQLLPRKVRKSRRDGCSARRPARSAIAATVSGFPQAASSVLSCSNRYPWLYMAYSRQPVWGFRPSLVRIRLTWVSTVRVVKSGL